MKKKDYQKPTTKVVKLRRRSHLLAGSNGQAGVRSYNWNDVDEE